MLYIHLLFVVRSMVVHMYPLLCMLCVNSICIVWNSCIPTGTNRLTFFVLMNLFPCDISNFHEGNFSNLTWICKQVHMNIGIWHVYIEYIPPKIIALHFHLWMENTINKIFMKPKRVQQVGPCSASSIYARLAVGFWYRYMYHFYALFFSFIQLVA